MAMIIKNKLGPSQTIVIPDVTVIWSLHLFIGFSGFALSIKALTPVLFPDVGWDKIVQKQDDFSIHSNIDVIIKLSHEAALHHRSLI